MVNGKISWKEVSSSFGQSLKSLFPLTVIISDIFLSAEGNLPYKPADGPKVTICTHNIHLLFYNSYQEEKLRLQRTLSLQMRPRGNVQGEKRKVEVTTSPLKKIRR